MWIIQLVNQIWIGVKTLQLRYFFPCSGLTHSFWIQTEDTELLSCTMILESLFSSYQESKRKKKGQGGGREVIRFGMGIGSRISFLYGYFFFSFLVVFFQLRKKILKTNYAVSSSSLARNLNMKTCFVIRTVEMQLR